MVEVSSYKICNNLIENKNTHDNKISYCELYYFETKLIILVNFNKFHHISYIFNEKYMYDQCSKKLKTKNFSNAEKTLNTSNIIMKIEHHITFISTYRKNLTKLLWLEKVYQSLSLSFNSVAIY